MTPRAQRLRNAIGPAVVLVAALAAGQVVHLIGSSGELLRWSVAAEAAVYGSINALFAAGLVLVYRSSRIVNFAHGAFGVLAATLFMLLDIGRGWPYPIALAAGIAAATVAALAVEVLFVRRFTRAPRLVLTVATIAVAQMVAGLVGLLPRAFGFARPGSIDDLEAGLAPLPANAATGPLGARRFEWFPIVFRGDHIVTVVVAGALLAALGFFLARASWGVAIRGSAENADRSALLGVNTANLSSLVWVISGLFAGVAAVLQAPILGITLANIPSGIGPGTLLRGLAAAVLGRMESISLTVSAAIGIAVFERAVFWAYGQTALVDAALVGVIVVALLVQRRRLARTEETLAGSWAATAEVRAIPAELRDVPAVRRGVSALVAIAAVIVVAYPWVMSPSQTSTGSLYAIYAIVAISLVVLTGWGGQISLGQFAFVAVGAIVSGALSTKWGWPFLVVVPVASLAGAALAVLLGLPALRIRGLFLAVTTLAFAAMVPNVLLNQRFFGWLLPDTVDRPSLLFIHTEDERSFYYLCIVSLALAVVAVTGLRRTRTGRVLIAMRDNERGAQSLGINLVRTRLATFAISGFLAAFAGVLFAHHQHAVSANAFGPEVSIDMFLMAVIGGLGSVPGVMLGALYYGTASIVVPSNAGLLLTSGAGVLTVLLFYPGGLGAAAFALRDAWLRRIAVRDRILVPSLLGDRFTMADGRAPIVPRTPSGRPLDGGAQNGDADMPPPARRYKLPSRIGVAGTSQQTRWWRM